jgi:NAD(P)H-quinone oxidoreductase subunit 5
LFANELYFMLLLVGVGALSALLGKIWKSVQTAVKGQLGCSTVAQMGFMILQCGLGYFTAAITHLMLHGFYKGYLFLSSGATIKRREPEEKIHSFSPGFLLEGAVTAFLCAGVFMLITGKGQAMNSGLVLTAVVAFAVVHGCREFVDRLQRTSWFRYLLFPVISIVSTAVYSGVYVGVASMMADVPMATAPTTFHWMHGVLLGVFLGAYLMTVTGVHRYFPRLYVYVLNASQPNSDTIVSYRDEYHV